MKRWLSFHKFMRWLFGHPTMCPVAVFVEWEPWPDGRPTLGFTVLEHTWVIPRNVAGRRHISAILGTNSWEWVTRYKIRARHRELARISK